MGAPTVPVPEVRPQWLGSGPVDPYDATALAAGLSGGGSGFRPRCMGGSLVRRRQVLRPQPCPEAVNAGLGKARDEVAVALRDVDAALAQDPVDLVERHAVLDHP